MKRILPLIFACFTAALLSAQSNVGIGTNAPITKLDIKGALALREGAPLTLSNGGASGGTNDNITLQDISGTTDVSSFYRITGPTAAFSVYGIAPSSGADGQLVTLVNTSGKVMTIVNNGSSTSANGIITQTGANLVDNAGATTNSSITLQYNKSVGKWYVTATQNFIISSAVLPAPTVTNTSSANNLSTTVNGATGAAVPIVNSLSNTSSANTLSTTVNGVTGTTVPIINSHTLTQNASNQLTSTVNGVSAGPTTLNITGDVTGSLGAATVAGIEGKAITLTSLANNNILQYSTSGSDWVNVTPASILSANTTHTLSSSGNTITSTVNGVTATASAVNTITNTSSANNLSTTVNGVTGTAVPMVNSLSNTSSANTLSTTVNGVTGATVPIINSHTLTQNASNQLTSTVNGVSAGPTTLNITGDVTGSLGAATVAGIEGKAISITSLASGNILEYNGTNWVNEVPTAASLNAWGTSGNATVPSNFIGTTNDYSFRVRTNNTERMVIDSLGNVGIGTTTPTTGMEVVDNYAGKNVITVQNTNNTGYSSVDFWDNTGALQGTFGYANAGVSNAVLAGRTYFFSYGNDFSFANNNNNYSLFIQGSNSRVGIGTNTPQSALDVPGNLSVGSYGGVNAAPTNGMIVSGTVGIGTSGPSDKLQVNDGNIGISNDNNTAGSLKFYEPSSSGNNYQSFTSPALAANITYTLPTTAGTSGQFLSTNGSGTLSWASAGSSTFANPTGTIGLTAVNGTATTGMRSDAAPALSQAIVPTWTGTHTFSNATYSALFTGGDVGIGTATPSEKLQVNDGNIGISNDNNTAGSLIFYEPSSSGTNYQSFTSPALAANITYTLPTTAGTSGQFLSTNGSGTLSWASAGSSTLANPTGTIGLTAVNGTATTGMRSDAAPALSQAIVPTWTGTHTFSNATYSALFTGGNVGIGTSTPATTLQVDGSISVKSTIVTNNTYTISTTDYCVIYTGSSNTTFTWPTTAITDRILVIVNATSKTITIGSYDSGNGTATTIPAGTDLQVIYDGTNGVYRKIN